VLGIVTGLCVGKPLGVALFCWVAVKLGWTDLPEGVTWRAVHGVALLAGIGFTMSLFISGLAFDAETHEAAKVGILTASVVSGLAGWALLRNALGAGPSTEPRGR
jgi:NhaA family Na+:H+ antiporter